MKHTLESQQASNPPNPLPCGCAALTVTWIGGWGSCVRFCPLHEAAGELLEALHAVFGSLCNGCGPGAYGLYPEAEQARAAIEKAKGVTRPHPSSGAGADQDAPACSP